MQFIIFVDKKRDKKYYERNAIVLSLKKKNK